MVGKYYVGVIILGVAVHGLGFAKIVCKLSVVGN
jgi:hypothetical protein